MVLNALGLFSGVATEIRKFVKTCQGSQTKILNHCRAIPGYESLYEQAMKDGGAVQYSSDLKDCSDLDQDSIYVAGGLKQAIINFRRYSSAPVSVEVKNIEEIQTACELEVALIKFGIDTYPFIKENLKSVSKGVKTEIYGQISLESVLEIVKLGVDFINLEPLTPCFNPVDFELIFDRQ